MALIHFFFNLVIKIKFLKKLKSGNKDGNKASQKNDTPAKIMKENIDIIDGKGNQEYISAENTENAENTFQWFYNNFLKGKSWKESLLNR